MQIHISPNDGIPIYRQIVNQIKYLAASERLDPGDQLPPVRKLAEQLIVNPNTVARAYRELENAGILVSRRGAGVFVSNAVSPLTRKEKNRILAERSDALLTEARQMNVDIESLIELIRLRDDAMRLPPGSKSNE